MEEQLISFRTAKLAREKGFNIDSKLGFFSNYDDSVNPHIMDGKTSSGYYLATQSLLQKFLREEYNIIVTVSCAIQNDWWYQLHYNPTSKTKVYTSTDLLGDYKTYEEALEEGLYEALKTN